MRALDKKEWDAPTGFIDSDCGMLRYLQWSSWDIDRPVILFIGLHPFIDEDGLSLAALQHYETFARKADAGGLCLMNLFPFKARSRIGLMELGFPFQADEVNERAILNSVAALKGSRACILRTWGDVGPKEIAISKQILRVDEILRELGR